MKVCSKCGNDYPNDKRQCPACSNLSKKKRRASGKEDRSGEYARRNLKIKTEVFLAYAGRIQCQHCPCTDIRVLSIDHINGGGNQHRRELKAIGVGGGHSFYKHLKSQGFPAGYQVLCMNCQFIKAMTERKRVANYFVGNPLAG